MTLRQRNFSEHHPEPDEDKSKGGIMSALCGIDLTIESLTLLRRTLKELNFHHKLLEEIDDREKQLFAMETPEGTIEKVNIIITDSAGTRIGLQKQHDGQYRVITSASSAPQMQKQEAIANRIKQRYAYNRIKEELQSKGYSLVEEQKSDDNTIKLVARRWR